MPLLKPGISSSPLPILLALLLLLPTMLHAFLTTAPTGRMRLLQAAATRRFSSPAGAAAGGASDGAAQQPTQPIQPSPEALATFARVFPSQAGADLRPVVLFDGVCAFCNKGIDTVLRLDVNRKLRCVFNV